MDNKQKIDELLLEINNLRAERDKRMEEISIFNIDKKIKEVEILCNTIEEKILELGKWNEIYFREGK